MCSTIPLAPSLEEEVAPLTADFYRRALRVLVDAGLTPGDAQQALFAIGAYVIGSAAEWQAEADRNAERPLPSPDDDEANAMRADVLADQPFLLAAMTDLLRRPHEATFEYGLDLLILGLRARYVPEG